MLHCDDFAKPLNWGNGRHSGCFVVTAVIPPETGSLCASRALSPDLAGRGETRYELPPSDGSDFPWSELADVGRSDRALKGVMLRMVVNLSTRPATIKLRHAPYVRDGRRHCFTLAEKCPVRASRHRRCLRTFFHMYARLGRARHHRARVA